MKLITSFALITVLVMAACLDSCKSEDYEWSPQDVSDSYVANTQQAYFDPSQLATTIELQADANTFSIPVTRTGTEAGTVRVSSTVLAPNVQNIQGGTSVSFAAGQSVGNLVYTYDLSKLQLGQFDTLVVTIAPDCATPYGSNTLTFLVGQSEPWVSLGTGYFSDHFSGEGTYEVEIMQNALQPTRFRILNPYNEMAFTEYPDDVPGMDALSEYMEITLLQPGDELAGATITREGIVYYSSTLTGYLYDEDYGIITADHPADYSSNEELFPDGVTEEALAYCSVSSWQEPDAEGNVLPAIINLSAVYAMTKYGPDWNYATDPQITITFPGVQLLDYSAKVEFVSIENDVNGNTFAVANLELGADVAAADLYILKFDEEAEDYDIENGIYNATNGENKVVFSDTPEGYYCLAVFTYDAEGNEKGSIYTEDIYFNDGKPAQDPEKVADPEEGGDDDEAEEGGSTEARKRLLARHNVLKAIKAYKTARGK